MTAAKWGLVATVLALIGLGFASMSTNQLFNVPNWIPAVFFIAAGITFTWLIILLVKGKWKKHPKADKQKELGTSKYASGSHRYSLSVAGVKVVIDAIEESTVHISITGTVDNRPTAVVLNKEDLLTNLTLEERLKKYADALADADLKRSIQG